jgi:hypothetical protein
MTIRLRFAPDLRLNVAVETEANMIKSKQAADYLLSFKEEAEQAMEAVEDSA